MYRFINYHADTLYRHFQQAAFTGDVLKLELKAAKYAKALYFIVG